MNLPTDNAIPDSVQSGILSNSIYNTTLKINDDRITEFLTFAECLVFQKEHSISETGCFHHQVKAWGITYQLSPSEGAIHHLKNWMFILLHLLTYKQSQFIFFTLINLKQILLHLPYNKSR
jgi:hypothetical protein